MTLSAVNDFVWIRGLIEYNGRGIHTNQTPILYGGRS